MATTIETLADLQAWEGYRTFMKERLKQIPADSEEPFFMSKKKLDFDEDGKPWKGYAVLAGAKGLIAAKKVKKEGVQFREGTCKMNGKELVVSGLDPGLLKHADLLFKKLRLGYSVAVGEAGAAEGDAEFDLADLERRIKEGVEKVKRANVVDEPSAQPFLRKAAELLAQAEKALTTDPGSIDDLLEQVDDLATQAVGEVLEGGDRTESQEFEARRKELVDEIKAAAALREPGNQEVLKQSAGKVKDAEAARDKLDFKTANKVLDEIEALLAEVVEGPEPGDDEDPDLAGLSDWAAYRNFMKVNLKRLAPEGGPIYVSRKKADFTVEGKPYKGFAVLVGKKARITVQALKKEGTLFQEGVCVREGKELRVGGIKPELVKGAAKTFLKLRLGRKVVFAEDLGGAPSEGGDADFQELLDTLCTGFRSAGSRVDGQVRSLQDALKASGDPQLTQIAESGLGPIGKAKRAPVDAALGEVQAASPDTLPAAIEKARKAIADYTKFVNADEQITACDQNPFGVAVSIRGTLAPALAELDKALASAAAAN